MKMSSKIFAGFGTVMLVGLIFSGISMFIMKQVSKEARILSDQYMPQTRISSHVERNVLNAVAEMRGYDFSYDEAFLASSRKDLAQVGDGLREAVQLAEKHEGLKSLLEKATEAGSRVREFGDLVNETEKAGKEIQAIRKKLDGAAQDFIKACIEFQEDQTELMDQSIKSGSDQGQVLECLAGIRAMDGIVQLGYAIQLDTATGQLLREARIIEEAAKKFQEMENELNGLQKNAKKDITINQLEEIRISAANYKANMKKLLAGNSVLMSLGEKRRIAGDAISTSVMKTAAEGIGNTINYVVKMVNMVNRSTGMLLVGGICGLLVSIVLIIWITRGIAGSLNRIIRGLGEGATHVASAAGQVSSASQSLSQGASEQAASIEETSSSLEEMSSMTKMNAEHADQADGLMKEASQVVGHANDSMKGLTRSMEEITTASEQTSKIIKTIDEIAFQTNLLALNAAVEAARAGEAGAGFAVVAGEVRNLAMRAADAAKNTADLIEGTVKKVKDGSGLLARTNEAFAQVADKASKVGGLVAEIAAASKEQSQGIEQVNKAVAEMDKIVQQNAASAEENASASQEMNGQAEKMEGYVNDLVAMVVGGNGRGSGTQYASRTERTRSHQIPGENIKEAAAGNIEDGNKVVEAKAKEVNPEQVIPLKGDDFKDF